MLAHDRRGTGEPLLLLHGLGGARTSWYPILDRLADEHDVVALDLPGFGRSRPAPVGPASSPAGLAAAVAETMDELGWTTAHLAGVSLGGWVSLELAALGRADSVTAFAPAGLWGDLSGVKTNQSGVASVVRARRAARLARPVLPAVARIRVLGRSQLRGVMAHPELLPARHVVDSAVALADSVAFDAVHRALLSAQLPDPARITCPVSVVFGDADRVLPGSFCQQVDRLGPHTRVERWNDVGHMVVWDAPDRSRRLVLETTGALARRPVREPEPQL